ncbi:MAG: hypothetical protein P1U56_20870 [Saprospiraceae bacterium]|nr:hypothetical protein [Saprospiraceae bacterium]
MTRSIPLLILVLIASEGFSQCTNTFQYPSFEVVASSYNDTVTISNVSYAGDYAIIREMAQGETYEISSNNPNDYLTIREADDTSILLSHGPAPLSFTANTIDRISVHINLITPSCGTINEARTTRIVCTSCEGTPPKIGIRSTEPEATLDVDGEIKLGDSQRPPQAGMIRWNSTTSDFEGHNGEQWISLTKANSSSWGAISNATVNENQKIVADNPEFDFEFGSSVAFEGDYAVIGAPQFSEFQESWGIGDAYIFHRENDTWVQTQKISANDAVTNDRFGCSVDISGDYIAIGSNYANIGSNASQGAVYIFKRTLNTWSQINKLVASDGLSYDWFGSDVSLDGATLCVSAPTHGSDNHGAVYIYKRNGSSWTETTKLSPTTSDFANVGSSIDLQNNYLMIGAPGVNVSSNTAQGKVFVYTYNGASWSLQDEITADDGVAQDRFGSSVAIDNLNAVIGAPNRDVGSYTNQGVAYIYTRSGSNWNLVNSVNAAEGEAYHFFGDVVDISGDEIVIGSDNYDHLGNSFQGAAYLFEKISSTKVIRKSKALASDGNKNHYYGCAIHMSDDLLFIGAKNADGDNGRGAVYILTKN